MRRIFFMTCVFALSGCAVTSFAPPVVNLDQRLQFSGTQSTFNAVCSPKASNGLIDASVDGALGLVSNFILTYRCQADRAAEGRQFFEVPAFLSAAGAATAAAFGAGAAVAIGSGAAGAVLNQGKSYYAPRAKAVVLNDGLDALLCIQAEAVGIDAFTLTGTGGVVASALLLPIAGFLITGTSANIPAGSGVKAFLDEDLRIGVR